MNKLKEFIKNSPIVFKIYMVFAFILSLGIGIGVFSLSAFLISFGLAGLIGCCVYNEYTKTESRNRW